MPTEHEIVHATWEVIWIEAKRVERNDHGRDFAGAMIDYQEALLDEDLAMVTLRCKNIPFPPPMSMADREVVTVLRKGKKVKVKRIIQPISYQHTMSMENMDGKMWCPYCRRLLRFKERPGTINNDKHGSFTTGKRLACPLCNVSYRLVSRWNPLAQRMMDAGTRRRTTAKPGTPRRRRRR